MRHLFATLCSVLICTAGSYAGNGAPEAITMVVEREPLNRIEPVFRAYINIGTDKFTFIIPQHFHLSGDPEHGVLKLNDVESDCSISFSVIGPVSTDSPTLDVQAYRDLFLKTHPEGKIFNEFSGLGLGKHGPGFDLEWKSDTGLNRSTRSIYLPSMVGVLELSVTSSRHKFSEAQSNLNTMLHTLRSSVDGKLIVSRMGDAS